MGIKYDGRQTTNDICRGYPQVRRSLKKSVILTSCIGLPLGEDPISGDDGLLEANPWDAVMTGNAAGSDDLRVPDLGAVLPPVETTRP